MKLSWTTLLSALLLFGVTGAIAQDGPYRDNARLQTVQWGYGNGGNNADYQRGVQDGINSGRADANQGKVANLGTHPYYTNSNNPTYRQGFAQGYRQAYGQTRGAYNSGVYNNGYPRRNSGYYGNNGYWGNNNGYYGNNGNNGYHGNGNGRWHRDRDWKRGHDRDRDHDRHDRDRDHDHDHDNH